MRRHGGLVTLLHFVERISVGVRLQYDVLSSNGASIRGGLRRAWIDGQLRHEIIRCWRYGSHRRCTRPCACLLARVALCATGSDERPGDHQHQHAAACAKIVVWRLSAHYNVLSFTCHWAECRRRAFAMNAALIRRAVGRRRDYTSSYTLSSRRWSR